MCEETEHETAGMWGTRDHIAPLRGEAGRVDHVVRVSCMNLRLSFTLKAVERHSWFLLGSSKSDLHCQKMSSLPL